MRKLFFDSGRPAGRLFYCLISVLLAVGVLRGAPPPPPTPPATTTISDVIYRADGTTAAGTLLITWPAFTTADNKAVPAGSMSLAIGPFGAINLALAPNQGATPPGTYYKVVMKLNDGTTSEEFWVVPTLSPTTISAIRSQVVPAGVALQVVTRQYVDGALATKADNTTVVHRTGDESVNGVKSFSASPTVPTPTADAAAANKVYVDAALAAINPNLYVLKSGDTMTGFLTLSGNPTQTLHASTKSYVDTQVGPRALDSAVVHLGGTETLTGVKQFSSSPTVPTPATDTAAANKAYVDSVAAGSGSGTFVLKAGDTMTGALTLSGDPTLAGHASNKNYVDAQVAARALDSAVVHLTGNETIAGIKQFSSSPTVPTPAGGTDASNKSYVDTQVAARALDSAVVHLTGNETIAGIKQFSSSPTVPGPAGGTDASNKSYVDTQVAARALDSAVVHLTGNETIAGIKQFSSSPTVPTPIGGTDAANKAYVDSVGGGGGGGSFVLKAGDTMTGPLVLSGDPTLSGHAANKNYVDAQASAASASKGFINAVSDCGLVGDGVTDDGPALQTCINNNQGRHILLPKRTAATTGGSGPANGYDYYSSQTIHLKGNGMWFEGATPQEQWFSGGVSVHFPGGVTGIQIDSTCYGCRVSGILAYGSEPWDSNNHQTNILTGTSDGFYLLGGEPRVESSSAVSFGRHGFHIDGTLGAPAQPDLWTLDNCSAYGNRGHGLLVQGSDSNAGIATRFSSVGNQLWGVWDNSVLGNTYIHPHTSTNHRDNATPGTSYNVSTIVGVSGTVTVTTTAAHNFLVSNYITVAGTTNYNGTYLVLTVPTSTQATFAKAGNIAQETTGTARLATSGDAWAAAGVTGGPYQGNRGASSLNVWINPYAESDQTGANVWGPNDLVFAGNMANNNGNIVDFTQSPSWFRTSGGALEFTNNFRFNTHRDGSFILGIQAGAASDQTKSIAFRDKSGNDEWVLSSVPGNLFQIKDGGGTYNALYSTVAGSTYVGSKTGQTVGFFGDTIDFNDFAGNLRARMYATGGGTLTAFNTSSPDFAGSTTNNYMALYTTGADVWAIGATGNPTANPTSPIISFADTNKVTTLSGQLVSSLPTGTAPLAVTSTTPVTNLTLSADSQLPTISTAGKVADPALSSNIPRLNQANTYSAGAKQTFQNSATTAGINLASSADPSSLAQGDIWINASDLKFRGVSATQTAERQANKGAANGYASLDSSSLVPSTQLPNPAASAKGGVQSKDCSASGMIQKINTDSTVSCSTTLASTSVVTVSANTTADQNLMSLSLPAGALNTAGRFVNIGGAGLYSTAAGQTPTLTFKVKLCTVSGCGSGTVLTLTSWTTAATTASASNMPWKVNVSLGAVSTGATGTVEGHGNSLVTLGTTAGTAAEVRNDTVTAASSSIDLTAALFLQFTVATSTGSPSNSISQRQGLASAVN